MIKTQIFLSGHNLFLSTSNMLSSWIVYLPTEYLTFIALIPPHIDSELLGEQEPSLPEITEPMDQAGHTHYEGFSNSVETTVCTGGLESNSAHLDLLQLVL